MPEISVTQATLEGYLRFQIPISPPSSPRYRRFEFTSLHHPVRQCSSFSEKRSKSARARAIFDCTWTWRMALAAPIGGMRQDLSAIDFARSTKIRSNFAFIDRSHLYFRGT